MDPRESFDFSALLRAYRLQAGLTQEALAERAGLSVRGIQAWESGAARPHRQSVVRLASALKLTSDERAHFESLAPGAPRWRSSRPETFVSSNAAASPASRNSPPAEMSSVSVDVGPDAAALTNDSTVPVPLTSFVGRERELEDVGRLLRTSRLITVTGPGGVGKSRLALQIAADERYRPRQRVAFVPLALVTDARLVAPAIAQSIGVIGCAEIDVEARVRAALRDADLLLILDNFEHVLAAAPIVSDLLASSPRLLVLVTSRVGLNVYGEQQYPMAPLSLPPPDVAQETVSGGNLRMLAAVEASDAARLFVVRARAARPDFQLTRDNAPIIAAICRRVDGIPLAIELAAARVRILPPSSLYARLADSFGVLTGGPTDRPDRQRTMRNAIAWSYDLMTDAEKRLFRRLAVFAGNIEWEAAEAVATAIDGVEDILTGLDSLVSQSLLILDEVENAPTFRMLGLLREYGLEQLDQMGEAEATRDAHAAYFTRLAEEAYAKLRGPSQETWMAHLERERDNLRDALRWLIKRQDADRAFRLLAALPRFLRLRGYLSEWRALCDAALSLATTDAVDVSRARALRVKGLLAACQHDFPAAKTALEASLAAFRQLDDSAGAASVLNWLGNGAMFQGDFDAARRFYAEALGLERNLAEADELGNILNNLGILAYYDRDYAQARRLYEEGLAWHRQVGDVHGIAMGLANLAEVALRLGDTSGARDLFVESIRLKQRVGDLTSEIVAVEGLAAVFATVGKAEPAVRLAATATAARAQLLLPLSAADQADLNRTLDRCREALGAAGFAGAWRAGQTQSLDQIVSGVLEDDQTGSLAASTRGD